MFRKRADNADGIINKPVKVGPAVAGQVHDLTMAEGASDAMGDILQCSLPFIGTLEGNQLVQGNRRFLNDHVKDSGALPMGFNMRELATGLVPC
jgi:hypothetical protein